MNKIKVEAIGAVGLFYFIFLNEFTKRLFMTDFFSTLGCFLHCQPVSRNGLNWYFWGKMCYLGSKHDDSQVLQYVVFHVVEYELR